MFFKKQKSPQPQIEHPTKATFWGANERMICCKGIGGEGNEFNTTSHPLLADHGYVATLQISAPGTAQGLFIHAFYSGHWSFAVSPSNEDSDELPDWSITREWGTVNQHSETLAVSCPAGSNVVVVERITGDA